MDNKTSLLIITGLSGSGKTIALHTLEDQGYYCIDNLPVFLLQHFAGHLANQPGEVFAKTAVGIDARSQPGNIESLKDLIIQMRGNNITCQVIFLEAQNDVLIKRFSETRRKHPLAGDEYSINEAIQQERELLESLNSMADFRIDTTHTNLHELRDLIRARVLGTQQQAFLQFESFGFKHGVPSNVDFVFDVRCLPNPHWKKELRPLTGLDPAVAGFLQESPETTQLLQDLRSFLESWISRFDMDGRSSLTIGIGCTGGQHRSVFITEQLYGFFKEKDRKVIARHRELARLAPCP